MAFSNEKTEPIGDFKKHLPFMVWRSVRSTHVRTSRKRRECFLSGKGINKGAAYVSHSFRYEGKIITVSFDYETFFGKLPI